MGRTGQDRTRAEAEANAEAVAGVGEGRAEAGSEAGSVARQDRGTAENCWTIGKVNELLIAGHSALCPPKTLLTFLKKIHHPTGNEKLGKVTESDSPNLNTGCPKSFATSHFSHFLSSIVMQ